MIKYKTKKVDTRVFDKFICDRCGRVITNKPEDELELQETYTFLFYGGYDSVFGDGDHVSCSLCQHCLKLLIGDFCIYNEDDRWKIKKIY